MLGNAAMSVEIENNPDVLSKEEIFVKCTSKKKAAQKNIEDQDDDRVRTGGSVSDTELITNRSKDEKGAKRQLDRVKSSSNKSVGFLSDTNANRSMDKEASDVAANSTLQKAYNDSRKQTNKKRHHSVSQVNYGHGNNKPAGFSKRRRKTVDRTPEPKFLMGGTITDPLNLNSLADAEISKLYNTVTPMSSPLPHLNKDPDPVIVPADITDPLKLNTGDDEDNANLTRTLNRSGKKKRKGGKKEDGSEVISPTSEIPEPGLKLKPQTLPGIEPAHLQSLQQSSHSKIDKIVSPVLPDSVSSKFRKRKLYQEPSSKISRALLIESDDEAPSVDNARKQHRNASPEKRKYKRQHSKESQKVPNFNEQNKKFQYGNYNRYYGYRNPDKDDPRLAFLKREWFVGKTCLDIGCNTGHVTLHIAKQFLPQKMVGIDIDGNLIGVARKNIKHCMMERAKAQTAMESSGDGGQTFPVSMEKSFGPISRAPVPTTRSGPVFPGNVLFRCANFVLSSDALLRSQKPEYDVILCLSVTKWIHLNWGDAGIKRFFRRVFLALRPGGYFILEPQAWASYKKKKKLTETVFKNFQEIRFMPDQFKGYLLSTEVGFSSCETIGVPLNPSKGFRRPLLMFTKLNPEKMYHHRTARDHHSSESSSHRRNQESSSHHHSSESSDHQHHHHHHHHSHAAGHHHRDSESAGHHHHHHHTSDSSNHRHHRSSESSYSKDDGDSNMMKGKCEDDSVAMREEQKNLRHVDKSLVDQKDEQKQGHKVDGNNEVKKCDQQEIESNNKKQKSSGLPNSEINESESKRQRTGVKSEEVSSKVEGDSDDGKSPTKVPDVEDPELVNKKPILEADSDSKQQDINASTGGVSKVTQPAAQDSTSSAKQESSSPSRVPLDSKSTDKQYTRYKKLSVTDSPDRTG